MRLSLRDSFLPGTGCNSRSPRLDESIPTLAEEMAEVGYETAAFFSNPWLSDRATGLLRGFASKFAAGVARNALESSEQGGQETVVNFRKWVNQTEGPFFAFVNLLEAHLPYDPPQDLRADSDEGHVVTTNWAHRVNAGVLPLDEVDWDRVGRLYRGDVTHADRYLGELVRIVESLPRDRETVIVVTSDHGENLGEHGLADHQFCVYETLLGVPLVIVASGVEPGTRETPTMTTDLFPTILDLAGLAEDRANVKDRSLARRSTAKKDRAVFAQYAGGSAPLLEPLLAIRPDLDTDRFTPAYVTVRKGPWRLTLSSDGRSELHELTQDPDQLDDVADLHPEVVRELNRLAVVVTGPPQARESGTLDLDDDLRDALRSLGYLK